MHKPTPKRPETPLKAQVIIHLFTSTDGEWGHWVQVKGDLHPAQAIRLAIRALRERLRRRIW